MLHKSRSETAFHTRFRDIRWLALLPLFFFLLSCGEDQKDLSKTAQTFSGRAIGTTYSIILFSDSLIAPQQQIDSLIRAFNDELSTYQESSRINAFNNSREGQTMTVGPLFGEVYIASQKISQLTDGYFDPTVGPLVNAYGFGAEEGVQPPTQQQIDTLLQAVGMDKIDFRRIASDSFAITKKHPKVYLEFNAIAKGTLVDYIAQLLMDKGVQNYLVEVGGEVVSSGQNLEKQKVWTVGIDDPKQKQGDRTLITAIELMNQAMAGSGNYRKRRTDPETGETYVHTVNPKTGLAEPSKTLAVNVIAPDCTTADALATAFMAMPLEMAIKRKNDYENVDVLIMYEGRGGMLKLDMTDGFKAVIVKEDGAPQE